MQGHWLARLVQGKLLALIGPNKSYLWAVFYLLSDVFAYMYRKVMGILISGPFLKWGLVRTCFRTVRTPKRGIVG